MKLIFIGGGKVAFFLANALKKDHEIIMIEKDITTARQMANQLSSAVVHGDGTALNLLSSVCSGADMMVALTGKDEDNLIACQLAKKHFQISTTIARVNNPKNMEIMNLFGVDKVYSGTKILAEMIEREIEFPGIRIVHEIENTDRILFQFKLSAKSDACGVSLMDYRFVKDARVVMVTSKFGEVITPVGSTIMREGDEIIMAAPRKSLEAVWKCMVRN